MAAEACSEITEGLLLYTSLQVNHLSRNSIKQLNPRLRLWIGSTGKAGGSSNGREAPPLRKEFQVQILASGLGCYYLDGTSFLNTLCKYGSSFKHCLKSSTITEVQLLCRCIGEHSTVTCCSIDPDATSTVTFREAIIPRPEHFNPATILIKFKVNLSSDQLKVELTKLLAQLHLMHITNPEIGLKVADLSQSDTCLPDGPGETDYALQLVAECFKHFPRTQIKLATSLRHFYSDYSALPVRLLKLRLLKGDAYAIPTSVSLASGSKVTLKVHCTAAVVPHLSLRNGRKIPANRLCKHLHAYVKISVFGPSHLPLVAASCVPNFPLTSLADWDSFGMELRQCHFSSAAQLQDRLTVSPSYAFEISNLRAGGTSRRVPLSTSMALNHHLELFVFLEDTNRQEKTGLGKNCQWKKSIELHHRLREVFQSIAVDHSKKFHQAVHSVLNKLICNYGSHAKTKSIMATVIPLISDAVASIVKNSTNDSFKDSCRSIMKVGTGEPATVSWVSERLWKAAGNKLGAVPPSDSSISTPNPDEPTSPELILAAGEHSNPESSATLKKADSESSESHIEQNDTSSLKVSESVHSDVATTCHRPETHGSGQAGLFQSRIASNIALTQQTLTDDCDSNNEDFDFEELSTFEDVVSPEESLASGLDVSDFDELEGVSEIELSFSEEQSQPLSPMLVSTHCMPAPLNIITKNNFENILVGATAEDSVTNTTTTTTSPIEAMDTENTVDLDDRVNLENTVDLDDTNLFSDEDCTAAITQDMNTCTGQAFSQQVNNRDESNFTASTLPCEESEQHVPGRCDEAKKLNDCSEDGYDTDGEMSHMSDKEWTELSFESPEFLHGNNRGNDFTSTCTYNVHPTTMDYSTTAHQCILPPSVEQHDSTTNRTSNIETCTLKQTSNLQKNSAFDSLEDYEETLSVNGDDISDHPLTTCNNSMTPPSGNNSVHLSDISQTVLTRQDILAKDGGGVEERREMAEDFVCDTLYGLLTCEVTDDDFCWESEQ